MIVRGELPLPNVFWNTTEEAAVASILGAPPRPPVLGQFALAHAEGGCRYLIRDRLGLNKCFFHLDRDARVLTVGSFIIDVARATGDYNNVFSVPPGHYLKIDEESLDVTDVAYYDLNAHVKSLPEREPDAFRAEVDATLSGLFSELPARFVGFRFFVCLSGGLDSTVIAGYARRFLADVEAVTFSYCTPGRNEPGVYAGESLAALDRDDPRLSEDFRSAEKIAETLGLPFNAVLADKQLDPDVLQDVLLYGQDWRDFNVHCAWVNNQIGLWVRRTYPDDPIVFVTGDLMNEYVADYTPVEYGGKTYYPQAKVPKRRLRRFFVFGLESGDREIGIFHRHGISTVQPYSTLAEPYLKLPGNAIDRPDAKERLNLPLIPDERVRALVGKVKVRAQVGGKEGGTLGLFHDGGVDQESLLASWLAAFEPFAEGGAKDDLLTTGRYRQMTAG